MRYEGVRIEVPAKYEVVSDTPLGRKRRTWNKKNPARRPDDPGKRG